MGDRAGQTCGKSHTQHHCFSRLDDAWRAEFGDEVERPHWAELLRSGVAIFDLEYDAILSAMYALSASAEGDCYWSVPPDPGIEAAALGASEVALPCTAPAEALHTFTLDSGASGCFFHDSTTLNPLLAPVPVKLADPCGGPVVARSSTVLLCPVVPSGSLSGLHLPSFSMNLVSTAALQDAMVTTTTPGGQRVSICTCTRTGRHLATFTRRPGSSLYTLATEPPQVATSAQVSASPTALACPALPSLRQGAAARRSSLLVSPGDCSPAESPHGLRLQPRERFRADHPVLRLHSDRGGEFSSNLLQDFCGGEGILQSFTLPDSPQQNGIAEHHIGLVMEVARTSMIHAVVPHFLWLFAVRYAAHQLKLWPRVSFPETSPTLRWTGKVGDALVFRVWGSRAFVRDMSVDKLSGHAIPCFDTWLDNLQLYLLSDSKDSVSLFDLASGAATAPPATADTQDSTGTVQRCSRSLLPLATAALGRLLLPYLFPELSAFATIEDLVSNLRISDARYRATVLAEFLDRNQPPMFITLYFIVTRLPDSLRSVKDHFLSLDPTSLTVDLLEQHLLAAETSADALGAARGTPRPPFFEGCSPSPLAPSYASAAAADVSVAEDVGAASASAKRRSSKGKGGRGGGGGSGGGGRGSGSGGGGRSGGGGGSRGGGGGGTGGGTGGSGGGGKGSSGSGGNGGGGTGGGKSGPRRGGPGGGQRQQQQRRSETQSPQQLREWSGVAIFDLDYDVILFAMYALSASAEGDCYRCVPPEAGITAAALGASESGTLPGTAPAEALHTFTLDSGALRCFVRDSTNLTPLRAPVPVAASGSCRHLSHYTLLWHHRLGYPSLPRLRGMHSRLLVSGLPRSLLPLPPSPAPPCLPCVKERQRAAPHSSSFPPTTAPLQTLHMDVWAPASVSGQGRVHYFLLVVDDFTRYTTVFPLHSKGRVVDVLIPWIRTVRLQLRERFHTDLRVLLFHSDRGVMEVATTSMIHAAAPHFLWPFAVRGAEPEGVEPGGAQLEGAESGGAKPRGAASSGAIGAGGTGDAGAGGAGVTAGAGGSCTGDAGAGGAGAGGAGILGVPSSTSLTPPLLCPPPDQLQPPLLSATPPPAPSPYIEQFGGLIERREPASRSVSLVCTARRVPRSTPPPVLRTHTMALRPSSVPLRFPLPAPPESSLPEVPYPTSDRARAASPTVSRLLATAVTHPSFESASASALIVELLDFAHACHLDYATALVAESASPPSVKGECALGTDVLEDRQEDFECLAAAVHRFAFMLLAPEGDLDALDIPTPRSYAEAIEGPYSSQWQVAMDAEMASWKSTGIYVDEVPPPGANIVDGMWIFRVKQPQGSLPAFKARYVARGFTFLQGSLHEEIWLCRPPGFTSLFPAGTQWSLRRPVYGLLLAPRERQDTLRTTLVALGFVPSTADPSLFLRTDTSLPPFYVLVYIDDLVFAIADKEALTLVLSKLQKRHTCTDLGKLCSNLGLQITRDRAQRTITLTLSHMVHQVLQRFGFQFSSPQPTPLSIGHSLSAPPSDESVEPSGPYPELVGCLMYLMMCTRPHLAYPLSLLTRYVAPGRHRKVHWDAVKRVLRYLCSTSGMGHVLGGRGPIVLTGHADASWADDSATQRSSQGYTLSLGSGSGSISWRSTRSSSVLSSSCEAEIYARAMAAQELRWLTYLLTDLGEQPCSPPVLYVDNKAMIALC
ncbi:unnamed protein product [Closterium sp. NIES-54]